MLSWLERGPARIADPDDSDEITEFLVAPLQPKGADRGEVKGLGRSRLSRARIAGDAPHSLRSRHPRPRRTAPLRPAQPTKSRPTAISPSPSPTNSLLATAWPALEEEVRARFEEWKTVQSASPAADEQIIESMLPPATAICSSCPHPSSRPFSAACRPTTNRASYPILPRDRRRPCRSTGNHFVGVERFKPLLASRRRTALPRLRHRRPRVARRTCPPAHQARLGACPRSSPAS